MRKPGYTERRAARRKETSTLHLMRTLRSLANGRNYDGGDRSNGWSRREFRRLQGMHKAGMESKQMAALLKQPLRDVNAKLGEF